MGFFEYFDALDAVLSALVAIALLTPTNHDDGVIGRAKNVVDKLKLFFRR